MEARGADGNRSPRPRVSVIVPARNEEASLGACLTSLVAQTGVEREIIVVDDGSTDRTRTIARSFADAIVVDPPPPAPRSSGKCNAADAGARAARGRWLLFTDADTVHAPGSLAAALAEAEECRVALLSYEPRQDVRRWWERAIMVVIFAELNRAFPLDDVSDPASPNAAANGQYILITRDAYDAVGGFAAFAGTLLEDVALARAVKRAGGRIRFRPGHERVATRMYTSFAALREGWTKNLSPLFPNAPALAVARMLEVAVVVAGIIVALAPVDAIARVVAAAVAALAGARFGARIRRARFPWPDLLLAPLGVPFFAWLLVRSHRRYRAGQVVWKGRTYAPARDGARS
jgi:hypothetical protein